MMTQWELDRTSARYVIIRSVIIRVIQNRGSLIVYREYYYRPNWTTPKSYYQLRGCLSEVVT